LVLIPDDLLTFSIENSRSEVSEFKSSRSCRSRHRLANRRIGPENWRGCRRIMMRDARSGVAACPNWWQICFRLSKGSTGSYAARKDERGGNRVFNPRFRFSPGWNFAT